MGILRDWLRGAGALLADVALCCLFLFEINALVPAEVFAPAIGPWILVLLGLFAVDYGILGRGTSVNVYFLANTVAIVAAAAAVTALSVFVPRYDSYVIGIAAAVAVTGIHGAVCGWRLPGSNTLLRFVDVMIVALGFYLYTANQTGRGPEPVVLALTLGAMVCCLAAVNQLRTGEEVPSVIRGAGIGGKMLLAGVFALFLLLTAVLVGRASGQVHSLVDVLLVVLTYVYRAVELFFSAFAYVLGMVILFVLRLLPGGAPAIMEERMGPSGQEEAVMEETVPWLPPWLAALLMVLAGLFCLAWMLYELRSIRLQRLTRGGERRRAVRKSHFFEALRELAGQIAAWLRFEWEAFVYRRTPQGLLVLAERAGGRRLRRRTDESPGAYMRRLAGLAPEKEGAERLSALGSRLDQIYYGRKGSDISPERLSAGEYQAFVRCIRQACSRQAGRQSGEQAEKQPGE